MEPLTERAHRLAGLQASGGNVGCVGVLSGRSAIGPFYRGAAVLGKMLTCVLRELMHGASSRPVPREASEAYNAKEFARPALYIRELTR